MTKASDPLSRLARALGRRDESPNVELAVEIAATGDRAAVKTLIEALTSGPKSQHSDCIKVLYEVAERNPKLVAGYCDCFVDWLTSRSNRVAWGAMTALDAIALTVPAEMARRLPEIVAAADGGSVITRDHAVGILVKLCGLKAHAARCIPLLLRQLSKCPDNQFPMYCEMAADVLRVAAVSEFRRMLERRVGKLPKVSQQKRVARVMRRLESN